MARSERKVRCGRAVIRKTSLLHKIDPTALRSSFADMCIANDFGRKTWVERLGSKDLGRWKCLEIARRAQLHSRAWRSDRSPLHDVR